MIMPARQFVIGSSPRMRGTRFLPSEDTSAFRFIPAHAGNTRKFDMDNALGAVHPRACGEHMPVRPRNSVPIGSSPRMRGTHAGQAA